MYSENMNSRDYSDLIDMIVNSLANRGFVKNADNPAEIMITQEGINMCYRRIELVGMPMIFR
jgi:predicted transcriptional regulator